MDRTQKENQKLNFMIRSSMLAALALILMKLEIPLIPAYPFLKYDPSNLAVLTGGFLFGPLFGFWILLVRTALYMLVFGNPIGTAMSFFAGLLFVMPASIYYQRRRNLRGGVIALLLGMTCMSSGMIPVNWLIIRIFDFVPPSGAIYYCLVIVPIFNVLKSVIDGALILLLYKKAGQLFRMTESRRSSAEIRKEL